MKIVSAHSLNRRLQHQGSVHPVLGYLELTYRCNFNCLHCYCAGSVRQEKELSTQEIKEILDTLHQEGCLWLILTGGEPLLRKDFQEIYTYAKYKGFLITIFSNGSLFTDELIAFLAASPPETIEITVNGITQATFEKVTQSKRAFPNVINTIQKLKERNINLLVKSNCLIQNKKEIGSIKKWVEQTLGSPRNGEYYYRYDRMIYPRLNGDTTPCQYRLEADDFRQVGLSDRDMKNEYRDELLCQKPRLPRKNEYLYQCDMWKKQFFISPYGDLRFCSFASDYRVNLRTTSFHEGFYKVFPRLSKERFQTNSPCRDCELRSVCVTCPVKAQLECGHKETPVPYYCKVAHDMAQQEKLVRSRF